MSLSARVLLLGPYVLLLLVFFTVPLLLMLLISLSRQSFGQLEWTLTLHQYVRFFTDAYYLKNGVNPAAISGRRQAVLPAATADVPYFNYQRPVRALLTLPAYDHSGHPWYFTVLGGGST